MAAGAEWLPNQAYSDDEAHPRCSLPKPAVDRADRTLQSLA